MVENMSDELKELAQQDQKNASQTKAFSILSYICLAACIVCSIFAKWIWAGAFGVGIIVFSFLESRTEKKTVSNALEDALDIKENNL